MSNTYFCFLPSLCEVGCYDGYLNANRPNGAPPEVNGYYCPKCLRESKAVYKRRSEICHICFLPCFTTKEDPPVLCCEFCNFELLQISHCYCENCSELNIVESKYCSSCGYEKSERRMRRSDPHPPSDDNDEVREISPQGVNQ